jgi:hypothetical protein
MRRLLTLIWLLAACGASAQLTTVVVPNGLGNVEGSSSTSEPFTSSSFRLQMVFDASQFAGLGGGPGISNSVYGIAFRPDGASTFDVLYGFGGASVTLSTTLKGPDNLSPVFADNVGADAVTIYNGAISFGGGYIPGSNPQPFGQTIPATTPFYYDPARGNLLVDIRAGSGQVLFPGALDAQFVGSDGVSRVCANTAGATAGTPDTLGLVTRFNIAVIPEPATWLIGIVGLIVLTAFRRR